MTQDSLLSQIRRVSRHTACFCLFECSRQLWQAGKDQTSNRLLMIKFESQQLLTNAEFFISFESSERLFNRLRRVPPATMEKGYPANQQPLHWPSKNMAFVKTLALAFNTLFVSKVFLWKRGS